MKYFVLWHIYNQDHLICWQEFDLIVCLPDDLTQQLTQREGYYKKKYHSAYVSPIPVIHQILLLDQKNHHQS